MTQRSRVDDLMVVVPGILGSRLADADGHEVWGLSGKALLRGIQTFGKSVKGLTLRPDLGNDHPGDGVRPIGLMRDLHSLPGVYMPIDGYNTLLDWLERNFTLRRRLPGDEADAPVNLIDFAYDWRLSCRYNADRLAERVDEELGRWRASRADRRDARVIFLCHSMGGLVTRQYVEQCGGAEVTRRVITLGTPYRGSLDALVYLVNGLRYGIGPLGLDLTTFARSLPSLHQLTPDYACLTTAAGTPLRYAREVAGLPGVDAALLRDAALFHADLRASGAGADYGVEYVPVSGVLQPTPTTAEIHGDTLNEALTIDGLDEGGDGRVPRLSSAHVGAGRPAYTPWEKHGSLQNNKAVRQALYNWLTPEPPVHRGSDDDDVPLSVDAPEMLTEGETYEIRATVPLGTPGHDRVALFVGVEGGPVRKMTNRGGGQYGARLTELPTGAHRMRVSTRVSANVVMTALVLVLERGADGDA
ncbi:lipase/acyltransferase domain-containing protein [Streptomyces sp. NBC_00057]|uniref:lipase/acyltransferase domain-containing protein n=1 Tax=Streptomyces sp. NBC_00057 TaxID=2975634 RepID=UPI00324A38CD